MIFHLPMVTNKEGMIPCLHGRVTLLPGTMIALPLKYSRVKTFAWSTFHFFYFVQMMPTSHGQILINKYILYHNIYMMTTCSCSCILLLASWSYLWTDFIVAGISWAQELTLQLNFWSKEQWTKRWRWFDLHILIATFFRFSLRPIIGQILTPSVKKPQWLWLHISSQTVFSFLWLEHSRKQ